MDPQPLKEKNAIVTGAARGIGRAIAQRLAAEGARVAILDIDDVGAQRAAAEIGGSTIGLAADVAQAASVDRAFAQVADQLGGLDILVNNAGIVGTDTPVKDLAEDDWDRVLDINLKGTFLCSRAALRYMLPQQSGVICSLASISGKEGQRQYGALLRIQGGRHLPLPRPWPKRFWTAASASIAWHRP